jgi:hypothetical protein
MRILINYDHHGHGLAVPRLAADGKTPISGWTNVASEGSLLKVLSYYGGVDMECEKASLRRWGRGNVSCEPKTRLKDLVRDSWLRLVV